MTLDEYGARPCVCGRLRREHAHMKDARGGLRILAVTPGAVCMGYTDVLELQLLATGGVITGEIDARAPRSVLAPHEPDCWCLSCQYQADLLVPCNACGADEGEDCVGTQAGEVHALRRELRDRTARQKPTLRLVVGKP